MKLQAVSGPLRAPPPPRWPTPSERLTHCQARRSLTYLLGEGDGRGQPDTA